jgi:hypothetical protein
MRTVTFKSVIDGALARMGLDPTITPASNTLAAFTEYATSAVRAAWEMYPWPDALAFEQRQFYPDWVAGTAYPVGAVVMGTDANYYRSVAASTGQNPVNDTTGSYWQGVSNSPNSSGDAITYVIDLDQVLNGTTLTPIGEVLNVFSSDPRLSTYAARINWWLTNDGIVVGQSSAAARSAVPTKVWVEFTTRPAVYSTASYTSGATLPYVIAEAVKFGICAEAQREDGQFDKAAAHEANATACLNVEWDKLEMKQGQQGSFSAKGR